MVEPLVSQRFLTVEDRLRARATMGWRAWVGAFGLAAVGVIVLAGVWLRRVQMSTESIIWLLSVALPASIASIKLVRDRQKYTQDLEMGMANIVEGAPVRVWRTKYGSCFLKIDGTTLRVPGDSFSSLVEANIVKVAYLPESRIAVEVQASRGIGVAFQ